MAAKGPKAAPSFSTAAGPALYPTLARVLIKVLCRRPVDVAGSAGQSGQAKELPMPIDEYACQDCGREFETLVRSSTLPECPQCPQCPQYHSTQLEKQVSAFASLHCVTTRL